MKKYPELSGNIAKCKKNKKTYLAIPFVCDPGYLYFLTTHGSNFESPLRKPVTSIKGGPGQEYVLVTPIVEKPLFSRGKDLQQTENMELFLLSSHQSLN